MIAPELRGGSNGETGRRRLLRNNLFGAALIFLGLEIWRPYFFLTDDNLDGGFPFFTEVGRHLLVGRSPYFSDYLFGGHYELLRDPTFFAWHPFFLLSSLLEATPLHFGIIDMAAFGMLMLAAAGFVNLAWYLRGELALKISDGWITFYTLSFTYSMIALTTGASWLNFLGSHSALPWLALGLVQRSWRVSLGLIVLFSLHQILGSHLEPTISNAIFLSLLALGVCWWRRSWQPLACWVGGYAIAVMVLLPLLVPMVEGFLDSVRFQGVDFTDMNRNRIELGLFPSSFFFGTALWLMHPGIDRHSTYLLAMGTAAAAWCLPAAIVRPGKWTRLETTVAALLFIVGLTIYRPAWLSEIMIRLPLLKSMRWPFRELLQFQFFFHLLLVLRRPGFSPRTRRGLGVTGTFIFLVPLLLFGLPPTLNTMAMARALLFSGGFTNYWRNVQPLLRPNDRIAVIIPLPFYDQRFEIPYSLLSAYNYSCLTRVINASGYSQTPPQSQLYVKTPVVYPFGAWVPLQKGSVMSDRPELKYITLESLRPLRISLSSRQSPTIDLTPFIPAEIKAWPVSPPSKDDAPPK